MELFTNEPIDEFSFLALADVFLNSQIKTKRFCLGYSTDLNDEIWIRKSYIDSVSSKKATNHEINTVINFNLEKFLWW